MAYQFGATGKNMPVRLREMLYKQGGTCACGAKLDAATHFVYEDKLTCGKCALTTRDEVVETTS